MRSKVELGDDPRMASEERAMVGQAPLVVNAGLTFAPGEKGFSTTLLYNRVGRRIVSASQRPLPVTYEEARSGLDVAMRVPMFGTLSAKLDAKNLLDQPYRQTQGSVTRESYYSGRIYSLGLSWRP
jgi:outer membrane receptor protein involved in Fe transport